MLDDMAAATATVADGLGDAAAPTPAHLCGVLQREVCVAVEPAEAARAFLRDPDAFAAPAEKKRRHQHDLAGFAASAALRAAAGDACVVRVDPRHGVVRVSASPTAAGGDGGADVGGACAAAAATEAAAPAVAAWLRAQPGVDGAAVSTAHAVLAFPEIDAGKVGGMSIKGQPWSETTRLNAIAEETANAEMGGYRAYEGWPVQVKKQKPFPVDNTTLDGTRGAAEAKIHHGHGVGDDALLAFPNRLRQRLKLQRNEWPRGFVTVTGDARRLPKATRGDDAAVLAALGAGVSDAAARVTAAWRAPDAEALPHRASAPLDRADLLKVGGHDVAEGGGDADAEDAAAAARHFFNHVRNDRSAWRQLTKVAEERGAKVWFAAPDAADPHLVPGGEPEAAGRGELEPPALVVHVGAATEEGAGAALAAFRKYFKTLQVEAGFDSRAALSARHSEANRGDTWAGADPKSIPDTWHQDTVDLKKDNALRVIGHAGRFANQLEQETGAKIHVVLQGQDAGRVFLWAHRPEDVAEAKRRVQDIGNAEYARFSVPHGDINHVIGPGGDNIREIIRQTGAAMTVDSDSGFVKVKAHSQEQVDQVRALVARAAAGHNLFEGGGSRAGGDDVVPVELPPPVTEANPTRNDVATVVARMTIDEVRFCCPRCFLLLLFSPLWRATLARARQMTK